MGDRDNNNKRKFEDLEYIGDGTAEKSERLEKTEIQELNILNSSTFISYIIGDGTAEKSERLEKLNFSGLIL